MPFQENPECFPVRTAIVHHFPNKVNTESENYFLFSPENENFFHFA